VTFWSILRQRCWGLVLVVAGVCVITFIISHLIPGDPARLLAGDRASDAIVENIRQQLGLDQPLYVQFYRYVSDLFHGDLEHPFVPGVRCWKSCVYFSRRRWSWLLVPCCWHS
jgi:peptide/nickel transport system permease protein